MATKKEEGAPQAEPQTEPTFLKGVATMATLAEEASRKLRTEVHGDSFRFKDLDLSYLFPQAVGSVEYLERLEPVVSEYLAQTARFGLEQGDHRAGTPIEENTAHYESTVTEWMAKVYTPRKEEIDKKVDDAFLRITNHATQELRDLAFALCSGSAEIDRALAVVGRPELSLEELAGKKSELKTRFYEAELPHPEDLIKLYELCFNAEVKQRGWMELKDEKLAEALEMENVPLEMFAKYTGREVKLPEKQPNEELKPKKKRKRRQILDILSGSTPSASTGIRISLTGQNSEFTARDHVEGSNYVKALRALRTSYAKKKCPAQPTITINGKIYVRPPTLYEVLTARVNDFNSKTNPDGTPRESEDLLRFFNVALDSCTGRQYRGGTSKFKLIPICPQLVALSALPRENYLELPYADSVGEERDSNNGKYNVNLSKSEVLKHPDWIFLANGDRSLLGATFDIFTQVCGGDKDWRGMAVYINPLPQKDALRSLCVNSHSYQSDADGGDLHYCSRFLYGYS
ncbi:MAG TPA: hypothetical protein VJA23_01175 [Candidatus Nanoarchaeia archaeon]|nr:hypothetical protein [Candidatus Nanoarchaeia archaeon]